MCCFSSLKRSLESFLGPDELLWSCSEGSEKKKGRVEAATGFIPKLIMGFLRRHELVLEISSKDRLEFSIIEMIRTDLDISGVFTAAAEEEMKELLDCLGLSCKDSSECTYGRIEPDLKPFQLRAKSFVHSSPQSLTEL